MICPNCGHAVLDGEETCDKCQQSLTDLYRGGAKSGLESRIRKDEVDFLTPQQAIVVSPETSVGEVVRLLLEREQRCALVMEEEQVVGIFSERDVLLRLNTRAPELLSHAVSEFMTPGVETLKTDEKIAMALHKMDLGGYHHLPVTDGEGVVGMISTRDILRYMTDTILSAE